MPEFEMPGVARFLTLIDVAEVLNISIGQAYGLVRSGELPAIKLSARGQWRVERVALESFIQDRYEQARRAGLWNESEYSSLQDFSFGSSER